MKIEKEKRKKNYPSQPATTTSPVVSSYDFFDKIYTLASPGIQTAYLQPRTFLAYHYTTQPLVTLWCMLFFYINSMGAIRLFGKPAKK